MNVLTDTPARTVYKIETVGIGQPIFAIKVEGDSVFPGWVRLSAVKLENNEWMETKDEPLVLNPNTLRQVWNLGDHPVRMVDLVGTTAERVNGASRKLHSGVPA